MIYIFLKKLKSNDGSAMILAIVVLVIATMSIGLFTSQVINQIKFTKKTEDSMVSRYEIDGGAEIVLKELLDSLNVNVDTVRVPIGNSGKFYIIKTITIKYLNVINESVLQCLRDENYDVDVNLNLKKEDIIVEDSNTTSSINKGDNEAKVVLIKDKNSLRTFKLVYYINVSHKLNNTASKKFKVEIELNDITESNDYGISYQFKEIK